MNVLFVPLKLRTLKQTHPLNVSANNILRFPNSRTVVSGLRRFVSQNNDMADAKEFPPKAVRAIVGEVAGLLKERKESVGVAETVRSLLSY